MGKRILVVHYTPPGVIGGVEHIIHQHIHLLSARGYRVKVVAGQPGDARLRAHVIPEIDAASEANVQLDGELAAGVVSPLFHRLQRAIREKLINLSRNADHVIAHNAFTLHFSLPLTGVLWELAAQRPAGSFIAWCHDLSWTNPLYVPSMHPGYPWDLLRTPAPSVTYVTVSEERRDELRALWGGNGPISVVPNGIEVEAFLRLSEETKSIVERFRLFERDAVLLLPVRITRRKNIQAAIRAVRALKDRGLDVIFLISGPVAPHHPNRSRDYLAYLKEEREMLGVMEEVIFLADTLGHNLDDRTVSELYTVADVLLFPSAQEGFGLPILEAGLARMPVVLSDILIFREVGDDDVWNFPLESSGEVIADRVITALSTPQARLYRRVLRTYRWDAIVDRGIIPLLTPEPPAPLGRIP
jgi:glycosyltransferase involved in cell wall biosynthesis